MNTGAHPTFSFVGSPGYQRLVSQVILESVKFTVKPTITMALTQSRRGWDGQKSGLRGRVWQTLLGQGSTQKS